MVDIAFQAWPKTPRLFRDIIVTEKIDGTNACIIVTPVPTGEEHTGSDPCVMDGGSFYVVSAQSRNRMITPDADNYGFARWVHENAWPLFSYLGPGRHYGEWWGRGIQDGYGLDTRRFSPFNTHKHRGLSAVVGGSLVEPVPVLYQGPFKEQRIRDCLNSLRLHGSWAVPGWMDPEGICVFHSQTKTAFKVTLDNNDAGKWEK